MKLFTIVSLFMMIFVAGVLADGWKHGKHQQHQHHGHHQHGKVGYKVKVDHGGWGKHDKGWTEMYDSRDKTTGWGHGWKN